MEAHARQANNDIARLVTQPGWKYVKAIAHLISKEYECRPGKTAEEEIQWRAYSTIKWALDKVFLECESKAAPLISPSPEPIKKNANPTSNIKRATTAKPRKRPTGIRTSR